MKYIYILFAISISTFSYAQNSNYNLENEYFADGYDLVAYFDNSAEEGKKEYTTNYNGLNIKFSSQENLNKFNENPESFIPQYGGWCSYAMATSGDKVETNPEAFEIRDNKLYLFYKSFAINTLKKWKKKPDTYKVQADKNWTKISK